MLHFGAKSGQDEGRLRAWGDQVLQYLDQGHSVQEAQNWIDQQLSA